MRPISFLISVLLFITPVTAQAAEWMAILDLAAPIDIEDAALRQDDGTIGLKIKDKKGQTAMICVDGRLVKKVPAWESFFKKPDSRRYLYVGAMHPADPQAEKIPPSGEIERVIYKMLSDWAYNLPPEKRNESKTKLVKQVIDVISR